MYKLILVLFFLKLSAWGDQGEIAPPRLFAPVERSSFLPQVPKVNLITGEYCEEGSDLIIAGGEPLSIRRFYNHLTAESEKIYGHWRINPEAFILFNFEWGHTFVGVGESNSGFLLYDQRVGGGFVIDPNKNTSMTNSSGQSHPLNRQVSYNKGVRKVKPSKFCLEEEHCWWEGTIKEGSGRVRSFKTDLRYWPQEGKWPCRSRRHPCSGEIENSYLEFEPPYQGQIVEERRPNGNVIRYEYEDGNASKPYANPTLPTSYRLKGIRAFSATGILLGFVEIAYEGHYVDTVHFKGSDGREARFYQSQRAFNKSHDTLLTRVQASGKPDQIYDYYDHRNKKRTHYDSPPHLYQVSQPGGSFYETTYDKQKRVIAQMAPVGPNGERVPIARYDYAHEVVTIHDGENNKTVYRFNGENRVIALERLSSIERNIWEERTGNLLEKKIEDIHGNRFYTAEYRYDKNHNIIEEKVDGAETIYRSYSDDGFNLLLSESDRPGKEIRYTYLPGTNLLTSEIVYLNGVVAKRTLHFYDEELGSVRVKTIIEEGLTFRHVTEIAPKRSFPCIGLPEEVREYAGETLLKKRRYTYHPSGKIATEECDDSYTLYYTYDEQERLISATDPLGNVTRYGYDQAFNLISQDGPRIDQHKEWRYDLANRPIQELDWQSDGTILTTEHKYDRNSRVIATIDPSGFETRYSYDGLGRVTAIHHPDGAVERKEYNQLGYVVKEIDPNGFETHKEVNYRGQPLVIHHPDGTREFFTYNKAGGTLATHIDTHGVKTTYTYDLLDNLIQTQTASVVTTATYSPFRLLSETDALGETTYLIYDLAGRKIQEKKGERTINFTYDQFGYLTKTVEGDVTTHFSYNLKGELLSKQIEGAFLESYTYDVAGNRITTTTCGGTTRTCYNTHGDPIRITDPLGNATEIAYSYKGGFTKTLRNPQGITKITQHDARGREVLLQTKNASGEVIQCEERKYDLSGNQTHSSHPLEGVTHEWLYGPKGRLESFLKERHYLYDNLGRLSTVIKPDGREIHRAYDPLSRLSRIFGEGIDYAYTYDAKNRITQIADGINRTTLECVYDLYDNIIEEKLDSGIVIRRTYTPYGQPIILHLPDRSQVFYTYKGPYLYSVSRNRHIYTYAERNLAGKPTKALLPNNEEITIEWDPLLRWSTYHTPFYSARYLYDSVGNLTQWAEKTFTYDDLHQLISEPGHTYTYDSLYNRKNKESYPQDKNGNLLSDGVRSYSYDLLDRLITVTEEGRSTHYTYDALNRRISKNDDLYLWDGQEEIGMMRDGEIRELRILGESTAVFVELDKRVHVPIHDHAGSIVFLRTTHDYTAFGESDKPAQPWGYAGKRYDPESGLIYFGRRYYSPSMGRWITPDPMGFQGGPNLYAYVYNNPLLYYDPFGLLAHSMSETRNPIDFLGYLWYSTCRGIEWVGHNLIPVPGVRDMVETAGRVGRGGSFHKPREYPCVITTPGIQVPHAKKGFHNGIRTDRAYGERESEEISRLNGGIEVTLFFNPTHGLICDLIDCLLAKCGIKMAYDRMCARYYANDLNNDPHLEYSTIAHSHGCSRLYNIAYMLSPGQCGRISVEAYGPATIIPNERFKDVHNYVSTLDGVPWTSTWSMFKNVVGMDSNVTFLKPHSMNPLTEHSLLGDTYRSQMGENGKNFQSRF